MPLGSTLVELSGILCELSQQSLEIEFVLTSVCFQRQQPTELVQAQCYLTSALSAVTE